MLCVHINEICQIIRLLQYVVWMDDTDELRVFIDLVIKELTSDFKKHVYSIMYIKLCPILVHMY